MCRSRAILVATLIAIVFPPVASASCWPREVNDVPNFIRIVGTHGGVPDTAGSFTVIARDFARNPLAGVEVTLDFSQCSDLALCSVAAGGVELDCDSKIVTALTNAAGVATIVVLGGGRVDGSFVPPAIAPGAESGCVRVNVHDYNPACPWEPWAVTAVILDLNGALAHGNGVTPLDLSIARNDIGAAGLGAPYRGRADYNTDGALSGVDLSFHKTMVGRAGVGIGSGSGCATASGAASYCP